MRLVLLLRQVIRQKGGRSGVQRTPGLTSGASAERKIQAVHYTSLVAVAFCIGKFQERGFADDLLEAVACPFTKTGGENG